jgi:hypothetical protein
LMVVRKGILGMLFFSLISLLIGSSCSMLDVLRWMT